MRVQKIILVAAGFMMSQSQLTFATGAPILASVVGECPSERHHSVPAGQLFDFLQHLKFDAEKMYDWNTRLFSVDTEVYFKPFEGAVDQVFCTMKIIRKPPPRPHSHSASRERKVSPTRTPEATGQVATIDETALQEVRQPETAGARSSAVGVPATRQFTIASAPADESLTQFAAQGGATIFFEPTVVHLLRTPAVTGNMALEQALQLLLKGTGLEGVFVDATSVSVRPQQPFEPVGAAVDQAGYTIIVTPKPPPRPYRPSVSRERKVIPTRPPEATGQVATVDERAQQDIRQPEIEGARPSAVRVPYAPDAPVSPHHVAESVAPERSCKGPLREL